MRESLAGRGMVNAEIAVKMTGNADNMLEIIEKQERTIKGVCRARRAPQTAILKDDYAWQW